ncbi:DUF7882 family protein [Microbacterium sp. T32]|uniref:DUF7882 family protein n=1 Tax=Microbacterium sp. T32 TaxID=1776083 RepID=UPI0007AB66FA|nr:hypothetical protein [Microbacterium sp. T32]KZE43324.1 hypothetical protein AVW09_00720 [Microbacterium sp. T32]
MGRLNYDASAAFDIDDRLLAHLRIVAMNKLRRGESFMLQLPGANGGHLSILISPSMPLVLHFYGSRQPQLDVELLNDMMRAANGPDGLTLAAARV